MICTKSVCIMLCAFGATDRHYVENGSVYSRPSGELDVLLTHSYNQIRPWVSNSDAREVIRIVRTFHIVYAHVGLARAEMIARHIARDYAVERAWELVEGELLLHVVTL